MSVRVIPGIGPKAEQELHARGIKVIRDLRAIEQADLIEWFGKWGEALFRKARGVSDSVVSNEWEAKTIGEQETFERDTLEASVILERARHLAHGVFERFGSQGFQAFRTVTVTVRFSNFRTCTRSHTGSHAFSGERALYTEVMRLLLPFLDHRENPRKRLIRLIGVRIEKLVREPTEVAADA